jgi:hypothetical protein
MLGPAQVEAPPVDLERDRAAVGQLVEVLDFQLKH